ncbi:MAG: thiolase family protein [Holosporales bacterium]|jgi:acetyl-CoA C-acetyltransferase|nr:thiolase family protein [Holosporales bacterium]
MGGVYIVAAKRTPIGAFGGYASNMTAIELGVSAVQNMTKSIDFDAKIGGEVGLYAAFGCVLQAGVGQNPCRQVMLSSGLPDIFGAPKSTPTKGCVTTVTVNHVCGSGMTAVNQAYDAICLGKAEIAFAGGMENMSAAPYLLGKARFGYRLGNSDIIDHLQRDGLEDAYSQKPMVNLAEDVASEKKITRDDVEAYVRNSYEKAKNAAESGFFEEEIAPISKVTTKKETLLFAADEVLGKVIPEKIPLLAPVVSGGILTPATVSAIADGAASVILASDRTIMERGFTPLVRIVGYAYASTTPKDFTIAPVFATQRLCREVGWAVENVDLFEVNEAFATVPIIFSNELHVPFEKINTVGGACVYGHPLGCSGARIIVTLVYSMLRWSRKRGIATVCIGGGEGIAIALELP